MLPSRWYVRRFKLLSLPVVSAMTIPSRALLAALAETGFMLMLGGMVTTYGPPMVAGAFDPERAGSGLNRHRVGRDVTPVSVPATEEPNVNEFSDDDLDLAAVSAAQRFELDGPQARELVDVVATAFTDGGDAIDDAAWEIQDRDPGVDGEDFVEDVADSLGYDLP